MNMPRQENYIFHKTPDINQWGYLNTSLWNRADYLVAARNFRFRAAPCAGMTHSLSARGVENERL